MGLHLIRQASVLWVCIAFVMTMLIVTPRTTAIEPAEGLIAFAAERDGETDIYTMLPDGSNVRRITSGNGVELSPVWSPDGSQIAYVYLDDGRNDIYVMDANGRNARVVSDDERSKFDLDWSPDGRQISFTSIHELRQEFSIVTLESGETRTVPNINFAVTVSWSPDSSQILYTGSSAAEAYELFTYDLENEEETQLTDDSMGRVFPEWSPDGTQILFSAYTVTQDRERLYGLYTMAADGSNQQMLIEEGTAGIWSPDGSEIAFTIVEDDGDTKGNIYIMDADGGNVRQITTEGDVVGSFSWQPVIQDAGDNTQTTDTTSNRANGDGKIVFVSDRDGNTDLYTMNFDGSDLEQLTDDREKEESPVWSPDGGRIAFSVSHEGGADLYVIDADGTDLQRLTTHLANEFTPSWSPDGTQIAFSSNREQTYNLYIVTIETGVIRRVIKDTGTQYTPSWSPDGMQIVYASADNDNRDLYTVKPDGTDIQQLTDNEASKTAPRWSPDGTHIVFQQSEDGSSDAAEIYVMDADGDNQRRLTDNNDYDGLPAWSPDGTKIIFTSERGGDSNLYVMNVDGSDVRAVTEDDAYNAEADWHASSATSAPSTPTTDAESLIAFTGDVDFTFEIFTVRPDGSDLQRLTDNDLLETSVAWSPDGTQIVFEGREEFEDTYDLYLIDADGTNLHQLTDTPDVNEEFPAWSPDGSQIVFEADERGNYHIYVMDADGNDIDQLTRGSSENQMASWTPDGSQILFTSDRDGPYNIYLMDADGDNVDQLTDDFSPSLYPRMSPDGTQIVYLQITAGDYDLYVMDASGHRSSQELLYGDEDTFQVFPAWSPDGTEIIFTSAGEDESAIYIIDRDGENVRLLLDDPEYALYASWTDAVAPREDIETSESPEETPRDTGCRIIIKENLNLRETPETGRVLLTVPVGTEVAVIARSEDNAWWKIIYSDQEGWVARRFTESKGTCSDVPLEDEEASAQPTSAAPTATATATESSGETCRISSDLVISVREMPVSGALMYLIPIGQEAEVIGRLADNSWYKVSFLDQVGWASALRVDTTGDCDSVPVEDVALPTAVPTATPSNNEPETCQLSGNVILNVRETPESGDVLITIPSGREVDVTARLADSSWYKVSYRNQEGWVSALLVEMSGDCDSVPVESESAITDATPTAENTPRPSLITPVPVTATPSPTVIATEAPATQVAVAAGDLIAFSSSREGLFYLFVINPDGTGLRRIAESESGTLTPAWSPDGTRIAFSRNLFGNTDIYVANADGTNVQRVTSDRGIDTSPTWSPDGRQIAYTSVASDLTSYIAVINVDGRLSKRLSETGNLYDQYPAWSPDGTRIAFISGGRNEGDVYLMDADGDNLTRLTFERRALTPAWSPDGTQIAFALTRNSNMDIYTMDSEGNNIHRVTTGAGTDFDPTWSPDGTEIGYVSSTLFDGNDIFVIALESGEVRRLTDDYRDDLYPDWNPSPNPDAERVDAPVTSTPAVSPTPGAATTETFTDEAGTLTFDYLSGATLNGSDEQITLTQGDHSITVYAPSIHASVTQGQRFDSALEELKFFVSRVGYTVVGPETEDTSFGKELAHVSVEFTRDDEKGIAFLIDLDNDHRAVVLWLTPKDQTLSAAMLQTLIKIITTIRYTAPEDEAAVSEATPTASSTEEAGPITDFTSMSLSDSNGVLMFDFFTGPEISDEDNYLSLTEGDHVIRVYRPDFYNSVIAGRRFIKPVRELKAFVTEMGFSFVGPETEETSFGTELAHVSFEDETNNMRGTAFLIDLGNDYYTVVLWMTPQTQTLSDELVQSHARIMSSIEYGEIEIEDSSPETTATPIPTPTSDAITVLTSTTVDDAGGVLTFDYMGDVTINETAEWVSLIFQRESLAIFKPSNYAATLDGQNFATPLDELKFFLEEKRFNLVGQPTADSAFGKAIAQASVEVAGGTTGTAFLIDLGSGQRTVVFWLTPKGQSLSAPMLQTLVKIMSTIEYKAAEGATSPAVTPTATATLDSANILTSETEDVTGGVLTFEYFTGTVIASNDEFVVLRYGEDTVRVYLPPAYDAVVEGETFTSDLDALDFFVTKLRLLTVGPEYSNKIFRKELARIEFEDEDEMGTAFLVDLGNGRRTVVLWMTPFEERTSGYLLQTLGKVMSTIEYEATEEAVIPTATPTAMPTATLPSQVNTRIAPDGAGSLIFDYMDGVIFDETTEQVSLILGRDSITIYKPSVYTTVMSDQSFATLQDALTFFLEAKNFTLVGSPKTDSAFGKVLAEVSITLPSTMGTAFLVNVGEDQRVVVFWLSPEGQPLSAPMVQTLVKIMSSIRFDRDETAATPAPTAAPTESPEATQTAQPTEQSIAPQTPAQNGLIVYQREGDFFTIDPKTLGTERILSVNEGAILYPVWSPDGTQIVYSHNPRGNYDLYVVDADGSNVRRITDNPGHDTGASWSPDGMQIVYQSKLGSTSLYVMNADGSNNRRLTDNAFNERDPDWSPDGRQIVFTGEIDGMADLYVIDVDGQRQMRLTQGAAHEEMADWSPNGTRIAYHSNVDGDDELYTMARDGSGVRRLTTNTYQDYGAVWSPDGTYIAYTSNANSDKGIFVISVEAKGVRRLTTSLGGEINPSWQPVFGEIVANSTVTVTPAATATPTETVLATATPGEQAGTVMDIILSDPDLSTFATSVIAAGLLDELTSANGFQYTIFAPTNAAFDAMLLEMELTKTEFLSDPTLLTAILSYHLLPGKMLPDDLTNGEMTTLGGERLRINIMASQVLVNGASISRDEVEAGNGVVYIIDQVLIPPTLRE